MWSKNLIWNIRLSKSTTKEFRKLSHQLQDDVLKYLRERIAPNEDPRRFGKPLSYDKHGLCRYRVQDVHIV